MKSKVEPKRKPRYDYEEARKVYVRHRKSLGMTDTMSWGYRYVLPVIAAAIIWVGTLATVMALDGASRLIYFGELPPLLFTAMIATAALFFGLLISHRIYQCQCVAFLKRAGIDVPERDPEPSVKELWLERKALRKHRIESHYSLWQLMRFGLPVIIWAAFICAAYLAPEGRFPTRSLLYQLATVFGTFVVLGGYIHFVVESMYLIKLWKQVHLGK